MIFKVKLDIEILLMLLFIPIGTALVSPLNTPSDFLVVLIMCYGLTLLLLIYIRSIFYCMEEDYFVINTLFSKQRLEYSKIVGIRKIKGKYSFLTPSRIQLQLIYDDKKINIAPKDIEKFCENIKGNIVKINAQ